MYFEEEINELEYMIFNKDYIIKKGNIPILFTAPHTMDQINEEGNIKYSETYTKAIALYLNKNFDVSCMVKIKDTGQDSNKDEYDEFKVELLRFIKDNNIKLVIDLHGSKAERDFDVELGTLHDLSADYSIIKELEEAFKDNGITNIKYNDPFSGGAITKNVYKLDNVDVIQLEINKKYRDSNDLDKLNKLCKSLECFIRQYKEIINKQ